MDAIKEGMLASAKAAEAAARIGERLFCQNTQSVMNFKSQICTTREQSERLLALGLKKETADMIYVEVRCTDGSIEWSASPIMEGLTALDYEDNWPPAWSLGRLIKDLMPPKIGRLELAVGNDYAGYYEDRYNSEFGMYWEYVEVTPDMFDNIISTIEWLIKEGYFPKEYLV